MAQIQPWAERPFKMIPTPLFTQGPGKPVDQYVMVASQMAAAHNALIRALNSIYVQAPHVKPEDYKDFIGYSQCWYQMISNHHRGEETRLFPQIEERTEKGLMEANVKQHHEFEAGVESFNTYLQSLRTANNESSFSVPKLIAIIDSFAPALTTHLSDEIPTLLALRRYGDALPLEKLLTTEFQKTGMAAIRTEGGHMFFVNLDRSYEGGLWKDFPSVPAPVRYLLTRVFGRWNAGWWRFAPMDNDGNRKAQYAVGK
ncbi:hypothetical protein V494_06177 [Pseudogymnoascus sp. VKM F-4513 (FW-928)]|nr:hypothetical protein V494_06177 [Pseudogymnoascus sp. VKM F-4513 (FW-928)]